MQPGSIDIWNPTRTVLQPDPEHRALYDQRYRLYQGLYEGTRDAVHALALTSRSARGGHDTFMTLPAPPPPYDGPPWNDWH